VFNGVELETTDGMGNNVSISLLFCFHEVNT